ncbi:hypothetical protein Lesp01_75600 [Lentzea sp. NBRC 102530]|nr:hypothetical protein Lesp01_75600 [Lentzea sp. NBRC 102530]
MNFRSVAAIVAAAGLLAGCGATDANRPAVDDIGKQVVAGWKSTAGVEDAAYGYVHGLDLGQQVHLQATLSAASVSDTKFDELIQKAREVYWKSGERSVSLPVTFYSSDKPPSGEVRTSPDSVFSGDVEIGDPAELEQKFGPRPTQK